MAVKNSLKKAEKENKTAVTEYESNGEKVSLSPSLVKRYLVSGGGNVTDEEVMMFISMCRFQHLNPFLREAYLIKYGESQPATMVVGKEVFMKRARRHPEFAGLQAGIVVSYKASNVLGGKIDEIEYREGTFYESDKEKLVGGWAKVFIRGYEVPFYASVPLDEYIGRKKGGEVNSQWSNKPATMIRKVALAQALREAFPEESAGLYAPEEIAEVSEIPLNEAPIQAVEDEKTPEETPPIDEAIEVEAEPVEEAEDIESALFGE